MASLAGALAPARAAPPVDPLRPLVIAVALMALVFVPAYLLTLSAGQGIARDGTSLVVGRDFLNTWMYGRAAWEADPARYYDIPTYLAAVERQVGAGYPGQLWSYPPTVLLLAAPLGLLPYLPALLLWTIGGQIAFVAAVRLWTTDRCVLLLAAASPAALLGLMSGQFAFFAAAILLAALRWQGSRPLLAGALIGLLTIKPQLGLLFPLLLLATRNWRAIGAAACTALALVGLVALLWGPDIWHRYLTVGLANQAQVVADPEHLLGPFAPTLFMNLRMVDVPAPIASVVQGTAALLAAGLLCRRLRERPAGDDPAATALFLACAACVTPYLMAYDMLALATLAVLLLGQGGEGRQGRLWPMLLFLLPLLQLVAGGIGLPGPALIPLLFALRLVARKEMPLVN